MDGGIFPRLPVPVQWFDVTGLGADPGAPVAAISPAPGKTHIFWTFDGKIRTSRRTSPVGTFGAGRDITNAGAIGRSGRITAVFIGNDSTALFWTTNQGAVRVMADPWSDALGGEYSWLEIAPNGAAAKNATVAAVARSSENLSAYWIGPYGAIQGRHQRDSKSGWLPVEEIAPAGLAFEPYITAIYTHERLVRLFFLVRATDINFLGTKLETPDASPRWSQTEVFIPPKGELAAAVDISAVYDSRLGNDSSTTLVFPTPRGNFHGDVTRCDARDGGSTMCSRTRLAEDASYDIPVTRVTAVTGRFNTYVFLRHSDTSLLMVCEPSCGGPFLIADRYEIPSNSDVTAVADRGERGFVTLFYTKADGRVRAASFRGP